MGSTDVGRDAYAGKIQYGSAVDSTALNIFGKGTTGVNRQIHLWDNVEINKSLTVDNNLTVSGTTTHTGAVSSTSISNSGNFSTNTLTATGTATTSSISNTNNIITGNLIVSGSSSLSIGQISSSITLTLPILNVYFISGASTTINLPLQYGAYAPTTGTHVIFKSFGSSFVLNSIYGAFIFSTDTNSWYVNKSYNNTAELVYFWFGGVNYGWMELAHN
jgi:hypothetical protein